MGIGGFHFWNLVILLVIVLLLFGTKRLRNLGSDLGNAIKGFRGAMQEGDQEAVKEHKETSATSSHTASTAAGSDHSHSK